jgi:hypothetical protein
MSQVDVKPKTKEVVIQVNNRPVTLPHHKTSGREIKAAADIPVEFKLYGPKGHEISNDKQITVHKGEKFTAISGQDVS